MRYNDRVTLVYRKGAVDQFTGQAEETKVLVPATIQPVTDLRTLEVFGLLKTTAAEVHVKNAVEVPNLVIVDGVEHSVIRNIRGRKVRVFVIA